MKKVSRFKPVSEEVRKKAENAMKRFDELRKYQHENYRQDRKMYVDQDERSSALYDKSIITLSSGAFGLTATLISKIFIPLVPGSYTFLGWALAGFGGSMISTLFSFLVGNFSTSRQIKHLDDYQISGKMGGAPKVTRIRYVVLFLNFCSFFLLVLGSWEITRFIILNVSK